MACKTELKPARKKEIAKQAHDLLEISRYDFFLDDYVNVLSMAFGFGFKCGFPPMKENEQGVIAINPNENIKLIGLNQACSHEMQRFVLAHELGHYLLHYNLKKEPIYLHKENHAENEVKPEHEQEADWFAASLLMPEEVFKKKYSFFKDKGYSGKNLTFALSRCFRVPFESAQKRINEVI